MISQVQIKDTTNDVVVKVQYRQDGSSLKFRLSDNKLYVSIYNNLNQYIDTLECNYESLIYLLSNE